MWYMHNGYFWGMHFLWWVFLIALIILIVRLCKTDEKNKRKDPLQILKERFARGEITKEEFAERKKILEES
jgi:putative membrane protein